ncbi:nuclear pore-associated protein 1-like [Loxodonta africana]|uniref:nuclear pore-associated protein 1-like n=1 Tax=Loxodonta africana TaxID=9785 RepID=UPI0030CED17E
MGNFFSKLHPSSRRYPPPAQRPRSHPTRCAPTSGRDHPAAPAPPFHSLHSGLLNQGRVPLPPRFYIAPKRRYAIRQAQYSSLGVRPLLSWGDPLKKQVVPRTFGHPRGVKIPPPGCKWTLRLPLKQTVTSAKPVTCSHLPRPCLKDTEPSALGESRNGMAKDEGNQSPHSISSTPSASRSLETNGDITSSLHISGPLKGTLHPKGPENSLCNKAQVSSGSSFTKDCAIVSSCSPAGGVLPLQKPIPDAAGLSGLPKRLMKSTKKGLEEGHQPSSPASLGLGKEKQEEKHCHMPSGSNSPPTSACPRPHKRKLLLVPPPWDQGELPPPPKRPRMLVAGDLGLEKTAEPQGNHTALEDKEEATSDCSTTQTTSPSSLSVAPTQDSLSCTTSTLPVSTMFFTDLSNLSASPTILCSPRPSPAPEIGLEEKGRMPNTRSLSLPAKSASSFTFRPIFRGALSNENGGSLRFYPSVPDAAPSPSDISTPPSTSTVSLLPTSQREESPVPMLVDSSSFFSPTSPPPPVPSTSTLVFTSQPIRFTAITPTITATASANSTSQPVLDPDVRDMDTSPPSQAVIFTSPPGSGVSSLPLAQAHGCGDQVSPAKAPVSTSPPAFTVSYPAASFSLPFRPGVTPQPRLGTSGGHQQRATGLGLTAPAATSTSLGSTSTDSAIKPDYEDMDTTPPSLAVIFPSPPDTKDNCMPFPKVVPGKKSMLVRSSITSTPRSTSLPAQSVSSPTASFRHPFNPGATPQPTFGAPDWQQPEPSRFHRSIPVGKRAVPTQAVNLTIMAAQQANNNTNQPTFVGMAPTYSTSNIHASTPLAFDGSPGIVPTGIAISSGFKTTTKMPSAGNRRSLFANSTPGQLVFMRPATPIGSGNFRVKVPAPGPSSTTGALNSGAGPSGTLNSSSIPPIGPNTWDQVGSTIPLFANKTGGTFIQSTWGPPVQSTDGAMGNFPKLGIPAPPVSAFHQRAWATPHQSKRALTGKARTARRKHSRKHNYAPIFHQSTLGPFGNGTSAGDSGASTVTVLGHSGAPSYSQSSWGPPGHGTYAGVASTRTIPLLGHPGAPSYSQNPWGTPLQSRVGMKRRDSTIPMVGGPCVPHFHQCSYSLHGQSMYGTTGGNSTMPVNGALWDPSFHQYTWCPPGQTTRDVMGGNNTMPVNGGPHLSHFC